MLTKKETLLEKGALAESRRVREPGELFCHTAHSLRFYGGGISFQVVFGQSLWLWLLPGDTQSRWMPTRRILGSGRTCSISFWPFLNSSGWWRRVSSVFLTRTSCRKITHENGSCGAWPVPVSRVSRTAPQLGIFGPYHHSDQTQVNRPTPEVKGGVVRVRLTRVAEHSPCATGKTRTNHVSTLHPCTLLHKGHKHNFP